MKVVQTILMVVDQEADHLEVTFNSQDYNLVNLEFQVVLVLVTLEDMETELHGAAPTLVEEAADQVVLAETLIQVVRMMQVMQVMENLFQLQVVL